jgi:hypothetical protein
MIASARQGLAARAIAALVALALSGASRVYALHAPTEAHRCECKAHAAEHECSCAACRKPAAVPERTRPSCHPAPIQAKRDRDHHGRPSTPGPCVEGTCGGGTFSAVLPGGGEPFVRPAGPELIVAERVEGFREPPVFRADHARDPEKPPPRAG